MAKAILVIDMPKSCSECSICASWQECAFSTREYWCPLMDNKDVEPNKKPEQCPLKPIPDKKNRNNRVVGDYLRGRSDGYNACIDDILKGSEEE